MDKRVSLGIKVVIFIWLLIDGRNLTFEEIYYIALVWVFIDVVETAIQVYRLYKKRALQNRMKD